RPRVHQRHPGQKARAGGRIHQERRRGAHLLDQGLSAFYRTTFAPPPGTLPAALLIYVSSRCSLVVHSDPSPLIHSWRPSEINSVSLTRPSESMKTILCSKGGMR